MAYVTGNTPPPSGTRRIDLLAYAVILLLGGMYWAFCDHFEDIAWDSATYQELARSLRESGSYHFNFAPHIQYPHGLPLLLAAVGSVFGDDHSTSRA